MVYPNVDGAGTVLADQSETRIRPFLVIGLGKLGQIVGGQFKNRLIERHGKLPEHMKLVVIDSAPAIGSELVSGQEFIRIHDTPLDDLWANRRYHPELKACFDLLSGSPLPFPVLADGAGQHRLLTVISFLHHLEHRIAPVLQNNLKALLDARRENWERHIGILTVADGWGANASGLPLVVMAALHKVASDNGIPLSQAIRWGMFALPGGTQNATRLSDANSYALLTELIAAQEHVDAFSLSIPGQPQQARLDRPPFDYILLESVQGQDGSQLGRADTLYDMLVEGALALVDSPLGNHQQGLARDQRAHFQRRGVQGDPAIFSTQSVVVAEVPRESLVDVFEQTALEQVVDRLLESPMPLPDPVPWKVALDRAANPIAATQSASGRPYVTKIKGEILADLSQRKVGDKDRLAAIKWHESETIARRLPAVVEKSIERAQQLWAHVEESVANAVRSCLDTGDVAGAHALIDQALTNLTNTEIRQPALDVGRWDDLCTALGKASELNRFQRAAAVREATGPLLDELDTRYQLRAEIHVAEKLSRERDDVLETLSGLREQLQSLDAKLMQIRVQANEAAAQSLTRVVRQGGPGDAIADALLRYKILSEQDVWRAYQESFLNSTHSKLSDQAWGVLLGGGGPLNELLGQEHEGIRERLLDPMRPYFKPWRDRTIEDILKWIGPGTPTTVLRRLETLVVERISYSNGKIVGGQGPHSMLTLGVPDADISLFRDQVDDLISTGDPNRLVLVRLSLGIPASALTMWPRMRDIAMGVTGPYPLHNIPGFPPPGAWRGWHDANAPKPNVMADGVPSQADLAGLAGTGD